MNFPELVAEELQIARNLYPPLNSAHEAYAVILEEVDEFWEEVKKPPKLRSRADMLEELAEIAAMCQRAAEDLCLLD